MNILKLLPLLILISNVNAVEKSAVFKNVTEQYGLGKVGNQKATWADLNNDSYPDLITNGKIWRNQAGKKFINVTSSSGVKPPRGGSSVAADFNGDGIIDLYFTNRGGMLFLGKGNFKFIKGKTYTHKSVTQGACAADLNNDGYVDVYIANYEIWKKQIGFRDLILRNNKGELVKQWEAPDEKLMRGRGATSCDLIMTDGWTYMFQTTG